MQAIFFSHEIRVATDERPTVRIVNWPHAPVMREIAAAEGHRVREFAAGETPITEIAAAARGVDAVLLRAYTDEVEQYDPRAQLETERLLEALRDAAPQARLVFLSHFLVGHGRGHPTSARATWVMHDTEHTIRASGFEYAIIRPTWTSYDVTPDAFDVRPTQNPLADGFVTAHGIATALLRAPSNWDEVGGATFSIYSHPVDVDLPEAREDTYRLTLERDLEVAGATA